MSVGLWVYKSVLNYAQLSLLGDWSEKAITVVLVFYRVSVSASLVYSSLFMIESNKSYNTTDIHDELLIFSCWCCLRDGFNNTVTISWFGIGPEIRVLSFW